MSTFKTVKRRIRARLAKHLLGNNTQSCLKPHVNYGKLTSIAKARAEDYQDASPFPHIALDEFLPVNEFNSLIESLPTPGSNTKFQDFSSKMKNGNTAQAKKYHLSNIKMMNPFLQHMIVELNSAPFLSFLEKLTGIKGLLPDPQLQGGGVHITRPGGLLAVHADFNKHKYYNLDRRINLLLYCNPEWREEYGGHLELWSPDMSTCHERILPIANRAVIFSTTSESYHGQPDPLTCPEDRSRVSVALYYYTVGRPEEETKPAHETLWQNRPGDRNIARVA